MVGHRELPVGALDLNLGGRTGNPEDLVIVAFAVAGQNFTLSFAVRIAFKL
jgi:hypothetical protein